MGNENAELIKTLESSSFSTGGELNPEQQAKFITLIRGTSSLLSQVRFETVKNPKGELDKMHVGEPITESASENTQFPTAGLRQPLFNKVEYSTKKIRSGWNVTTDSLSRNIELANFEDSLMQAMSKRISTDMELLAIQGDDTLTGTTPQQMLLKRLDGWDKQTASTHIVNAKGGNVSHQVYAAMYRQMPEQYLADPGLRWIQSSVISADWNDVVAGRLTGLGDQAFASKNKAAPYGIPILEVPLMPSGKSISVSAEATPGFLLGERQGPFKIVTGTNDTFIINVDAAGPLTITLPAGVYDTVEMANIINVAATAMIASDFGDGRLYLESTTTGVGSSMAVTTGNANATFGIANGSTNSGVASGTADTLAEGSFIWLANPQNFIFTILDRTRVYTWFNHDYDRMESRVYNEVDAKIENPDAIVKAINVRKKKF